MRLFSFVDICGYFDSSGTKNNKRRLPYGGKVFAHWTRRQPLHRCNLWTRKRAHIEDRLFGFCWAFQSFRKRCLQYQNRTTGAEDRQKYRFGSLATNTRTGRPEPPAQQHSPEQHQSASYWSGRALEIHVLTLMGAVRQYQSHTAGNLSKPNIAPVI